MPAYPGHRYYGSGLRYVFLTQIEPPVDGESVMPGINVLHGLIAEALVSGPGSLGPDEVKCLRTYLGKTPEELGQVLKADVRGVERGSLSLSERESLALRQLVFKNLGMEPPPRQKLLELCNTLRLEGRHIRIAGTDETSYRILPQDAL